MASLSGQALLSRHNNNHNNNTDTTHHGDCSETFWDQLGTVDYRPREAFDDLCTRGDVQVRDQFYSGMVTTGDRFHAKQRNVDFCNIAECDRRKPQNPNPTSQPPKSQYGRGARGDCHPVGVSVPRGAPGSVGTRGLRPAPQLEYKTPHPSPPRSLPRSHRRHARALQICAVWLASSAQAQHTRI